MCVCVCVYQFIWDIKLKAHFWEPRKFLTTKKILVERVFAAAFGNLATKTQS